MLHKICAGFSCISPQFPFLDHTYSVHPNRLWAAQLDPTGTSINVGIHMWKKQHLGLTLSAGASQSAWDSSGSFSFWNSLSWLSRTWGRHLLSHCLSCEIPTGQLRRHLGDVTAHWKPCTHIHRWNMNVAIRAGDNCMQLRVARITWSWDFFFFFFFPQHPELSASLPLASPQSSPSSSSVPMCCPWDVSAASRYERFLKMHTQFSTVCRIRDKWETGGMKKDSWAIQPEKQCLHIHTSLWKHLATGF